MLQRSTSSPTSSSSLIFVCYFAMLADGPISFRNSKRYCRRATSDAEGITLCSRVHALTASVWSGVPLSVADPPPTCLFARLHAPRIVWPACAPHCVARIVPHCVARIHASMQARIGARACACARAACSPALGRGVRSFRLRQNRPSARVPSPPARQPAALPVCLS
jgi:hypothetical protein